MMNQRVARLLAAVSVLALAALVLTGCPKRPAEEVGEIDQPATGTIETQTPGTTGEESPSATEDANAWKERVEDVFFDYDMYELRSDARQTLQGNARYLKDHPEAEFTLEGHCDNRGTSEYNLALGQRRADAVRDYLADLGIPAARIRTISYGEEKPFAVGETESAWAQNRRVHFVIR